MFSTGGFPTALATAASPAAILHPVALQSDSTYKPNPCRPSWLAGERHRGIMMVWMLQRALEQGNKAAGLPRGFRSSHEVGKQAARQCSVCLHTLRGPRADGLSCQSLPLDADSTTASLQQADHERALTTPVSCYTMFGPVDTAYGCDRLARWCTKCAGKCCPAAETSALCFCKDP